MNLVFRVDADLRLGAGHAMRCLALAQAGRRRGHTAVFVYRRQLPMVLDRCRQLKIRTEPLADRGDRTESTRLAQLLKQYGTDLLILDGYGFTRAYQEGLRRCGLRPVIITDFPISHSGVALICPTPGVVAADFHSAVPARTYCGLKYLLIREEITRYRRLTRRRPMTILLAVGAGARGLKLLESFIRVLESELAGAEVKILLGANQGDPEHAARLRAAANRYRFITANQFTVRTLADTDLAFSTASTTLWELACLGVPVICFQLTDDQRGNERWLTERGYCRSLGDARRGVSARLKQVLREFRSGHCRFRVRAAALKKLIDGRGADRIVRVLETLMARKGTRE